MQNIFPNTPENLAKAAKIIKNGGVVAIPTDTLYGLSANALDANAIAKIYEIKHRPLNKPMIVLIDDIKTIDGLAEYDLRLERLAAKFWPGPLTVLLNRVEGEHKLDAACAGSKAVTFRLPDCQVDLEIIKHCQHPIVSTTANISGQDNPMNPTEIYDQLGDTVEFILDNGNSPKTEPSTIVDLTAKDWKILRHGAIKDSEIRTVLEE